MALLASLALFVVSQSLSTSIVAGTWDFPHLGRDAYSLAFDGALPDGRDVYYARYPNNQLLLLLVSGLFNAVSWFDPGASVSDCHHVAIFFNAVLVIASVAILAQAVGVEHGPKAATALVLMSLLFVPFWSYSAIYYSDIIPMIFIASELVVFLRLHKADGSKKILLWIAFGLIAGVAFELKATTVFVFMGALLLEAVSFFGKDTTRKLQRARDALLCLVVFCLTVALVSNAAQRTLGIADEAYEAYQFPYTHWVMMSLNETGGYNQEDVDFTRESGNKAEKQAANIELIKARLSDRGFAGTLNHLLIAKVQRTWGSGFLAGDVYVNWYPDHAKSLAFSLFSNDGGNHGAVKVFAQVFWLLLLLLLVFGGISSWRKTSSPMVFVAMFALTLFFAFELIWECNGRYVVHMAPLMLMIAAVSLATSSKPKP